MKVEGVSVINSTNAAGESARKLMDNPGANEQAQLVQSVQATQSAAQKQDKNKIDESIKALNSIFRDVNVELSYSYDKEAGIEVVKVKDTETGKTVREYPPEEIVNMIRKIREMWGIFIDEKV